MRISVAVPTHNMKNGEFFLNRLLDSLDAQTFTDFEIVITSNGKMAENTNSAIKKCSGEIVKILYMDDYLAPDALQNLSDNFTGGWYASGCLHDDGVAVGNPHIPSFIPGNLSNSIGSPSVVAFENNEPLLFDEKLSWMLDVDLYQRLYERYGFPTLVNSMDVIIGLHDGQVTNLMGNEEKQEEVDYVIKKHGTTD